MRVLALCSLSLALLGVVPQPACAQEALRPEITKLERLPQAQRPRLPELVAQLRRQARETSDEQFDLLFLLSTHYAGEKQRAALEGLEHEFAPWRRSTETRQRVLGETAWALAWTVFHIRSGHLQLAQQEIDSLKPESLGELPLKWRYRERRIRANVLEETGHIDEALLLRLDVVRLGAQSAEVWRHVSALAALSYTYYRAGQHDKAVEAAKEAQQVAESVPDDHDVQAEAQLTLGLVLSEDADAMPSRRAYEQSLHHARLAGDESLQALLLGNLADSYLRAGDYHRALALAQECLPLAQRLKDESTELLAMHNMGLAKIGLKRVAEGKADVLKAIATERQKGATTSVSEGWEELGQYLERAGDFAGAMQAFEEHRRIADTLSRADQRKRVLEAQEQFDAERREREAQLLGQQTVLQGEQIKARNLQLLQWGLLMASGLAAMVLLAMIFKRMRQTNRELARSNEELAVRSERDPLTGLANRRFFQREVLKHQLEDKLQASLFLIDIDHFKRINDSYGHAGGDAVLVAVAQRLRAAVREQDIVVRWGGEEFLVLVGTREPALTYALALRMLREIGGTPVALPQGQSVHITGSVGYASFPLPGGSATPDWERAIDVVDALMYQAKGHGRNQAWGLTVSRATSVAELMQDLGELNQARERGSLELQVTPGPMPGGAP
ncbi:tetratricopeptide repeat-containing diguanylate cyclase [Inhella proteolytica]|uniref:diguanylate cyclase n=1 Tax=Inhella proteolytica TaxID=2795029 RepID=A0A931NHR3_9BURK|nr:tetratricopeptide repeat-containing diguanylate cyclase [Inhella proteolytica]MBH9577324.1 GGDEF domain-containing protein [Inhella proteolytica]